MICKRTKNKDYKEAKINNEDIMQDALSRQKSTTLAAVPLALDTVVTTLFFKSQLTTL